VTTDEVFSQFLSAAEGRYHTDAEYHDRVNRELFETDARRQRMKEWEMSIWDRVRGAA